MRPILCVAGALGLGLGLLGVPSPAEKTSKPRTIGSGDGCQRVGYADQPGRAGKGVPFVAAAQSSAIR